MEIKDRQGKFPCLFFYLTYSFATTYNVSTEDIVMLISSMFILGTIGIFRRMIPLPSAWIVFFHGVVQLCGPGSCAASIGMYST